MVSVEKSYRTALGRWSGQERVARSAALFSQLRAMLLLKAQREEPGLSERALMLRVAASLYRRDPETLRLLAMLDA